MRKAFTITMLLAWSIALTAQQPSAHADANPIAEGEIKTLEAGRANRSRRLG
jgi:hypothetical protein